MLLIGFQFLLHVKWIEYWITVFKCLFKNFDLKILTTIYKKNAPAQSHIISSAFRGHLDINSAAPSRGYPLNLTINKKITGVTVAAVRKQMY